MYRTEQHYDPEGILGVLTSIVLTFLGLQVRQQLLSTWEKPVFING